MGILGESGAIPRCAIREQQRRRTLRGPSLHELVDCPQQLDEVRAVLLRLLRTDGRAKRLGDLGDLLRVRHEVHVGLLEQHSGGDESVGASSSCRA